LLAQRKQVSWFTLNTGGQVLAGFFQRNPLPAIQLGNPFIDGTKSGRIFGGD
jgi:hypothetical protein